MRRLLLILLSAGLVLVPAAPGLAGNLYQANLFCPTTPQAFGSATVTQNGDLFVNLSGLTPNVLFFCAVVCRDLEGTPFAFNAIPCGNKPFSSRAGVLNTSAKRLVNTQAGEPFCLAPSVAVFSEDEDCESGFPVPKF